MNLDGRQADPTGSGSPFAGRPVVAARPNDVLAQRTALRIFLWRSESPAAMRAHLDEILADRSDSLDAFAQVRERDVRAERGVCRLAVVGDSAADLRAKLSTAVERLDRGGSGFSFPQGLHCRTSDDLSAGRIAFMFPGQGS